MDSVFGMFFWALAIIAFGACIGAGLRGRPGRLFGLTILKIGLAGLFVMLLFVDRFPHNEIILWLLLMLMAGALISHMLFVVRAPKIPFRQEGRPGIGYRPDIPLFSNGSGQVLFPIRFGITGALLWDPEKLRTGIQWGESLERMENWRVRVKPFF